MEPLICIPVCTTESTVAASTRFYELGERLSRIGDKTDKLPIGTPVWPLTSPLECLLMSYERAFLCQADLEKASKSTIERKQMSTKTTLKRIALVAVSALGAGLVSTVSIPAANAAVTATSISVGTIPAARAGLTMTVPITVNISSHTASETITVAAKPVSAPTSGGLANAASVFSSTASGTNATGGAANVLFFGDSDQTVAGTAVYAQTAAGVDKTNDTSYIGVYTATDGQLEAAAAGSIPATAIETALSSTADASTSKTFYLHIKPDLAGTYSFIVSVSGAAANNEYKAGDVSTTFSFTTAGAPATATLTAKGGSSTNSSGSYGVLYQVTFKDSAGVATTLAGDEAFTVTPSLGYAEKATVSSGVFASVAPDTTSTTFTSADMWNGMGFFNAIYGTAASTVTLTGSGSAALVSTVTTTASYTTATAAANASATEEFVANGGTAVTSGWSGTDAAPKISTLATSSTIEVTYTAPAATTYAYVTIVDSAGLISGVNSTSTLTYDRAYTQGTGGYSTISITHAACATAGTTCFTADSSVAGDFASAVSVVSEAPTMTGGSITADNDTVRLATGSTLSLGATVKNQFSQKIANVSVTVTVSGRNSAKASQTLVTDASGRVTYSFTDTGTSGTSDSITFTSTVNDSVSIVYGTATAGSIMVDTPSTDLYTATTNAGGDTYPKAFSEINAAGTYLYGAEYGQVAVTAIVKDANGSVMAGMPVNWTVTGDGCAITSTTATTYTTAGGIATAYLYAWKAGNCVVKATSGGLSDEANSYWRQTGTAEVRTLEAKVTGGSIVVTAKDRFGNPISSVPLKATRTSGTGSFGGSSSATGSTNADGQNEFVVSNGSAKVTVTFDSTDASTYGQSDALAGLIDGTSTSSTNKFLAYEAGTALVDEEGVGDTFSAAGVNSVTVDVTAVNEAAVAAEAASDAAAEAIDAANAATDAANLAAEAADAATVAAEEARDAADAATAAVEELATQVATLMAALKAQITTLANTVAKIAKKVKA